MKVVLIVLAFGFGERPVIEESIPMESLEQCERVAAEVLRIPPSPAIRSITAGCTIQIARSAAR
jgi:hypothetical protein